ncbi:MAG TPA: O-antigen ligase family protein [Ruminiclostridium sp.]
MKNKKAVSTSKFSFKTLPIGLVLLIVPLIVFLKIVPLEGVSYDYWTGAKEYADFFSYYKSIWLTIFTVASSVFALYYLHYKKISIKFTHIYIPLAAYTVLVFLSTVFSDYKNISLKGFTDRCEGFLVILCYIVLCFLTSFLVTNLSDIKFLYICLFISVLILSLLGISQFFGFDFLQTHLGKLLILPKENSNMVDVLKFNFPKNYIYSTMYNPNYVGSYFAMIFPISILLFIFSKNMKQRLFTGVIAILSFMNFVGCLSSAGYVGGLFTLLVICILLRKRLVKNIVPIISLACIFVVCTFVMNYVSGGAILSQTGINKTLPVTASAANQKVAKQPVVNNITDVNIAGDKMTIDVNNIPLYISFNKQDQKFDFKDSENSSISLVNDTKNEGSSSLSDGRFTGINIIVKNNTINFQAPNTQFFVMLESEGFTLLNQFGKPTKMITADSIGFEGKERLGSSRGYIWSRSLPLLKDTILLGHGPDTFAIYFPQNDYISKLKYFDNMFILVDKPHNLYLQIAINTGVLSLIAFLLLNGIYLISSLKLYLKPKSINEYYIAGISSFIAVLGFLVAALFNDSVVSVSPVFWILLGLGVACNRLYRTISHHAA